MHRRINITIDEDLLRQIDAAAKLRGLSRSAFFANACACIIGELAEDKRLMKKLRLVEKENKKWI